MKTASSRVNALLLFGQTDTNDMANAADAHKELRVNKNHSKVYHIGFLKVHKAGSTTMQNIFFRFGLKHDLTFVVPRHMNYFLSTESALPVKNGSHMDILACHSVYSRKLFSSVLPADSVMIGIIRDPLERMISAAYYFRDVWKNRDLSRVPRKNFIQNLINRPDLYDRLPFSKTKNSMGEDFGFPSKTTINDQTNIKNRLEMLKSDFMLVLVMERFEESLVLLKRYLHWDFSDIIYLKANSHFHQNISLAKSEKEKFKRTCFLDYAIYDTFYEIFDEKVKNEGAGFQDEVNHFRSILPLVEDFCSGYSIKKLPLTLIVSASKWNEKFAVTYRDCRYMKLEELKFLKVIRQRHILMHTIIRNINADYKKYIEN